MLGSSISLQERLQMKREPLDKWSIREKLCLATAVMRSGDQNWMSVSRTLKPFGEPNRPADWFHQKNCAAQYGALLEQIETPKRKKRAQEPPVLETPTESILKNLQAQRQEELKQLLADEKREYLNLQEHVRLINSKQATEEQLDEWCAEIDEEDRLKDLVDAENAAWLKEREQRTVELERAWRPVPKIIVDQQQQNLVIGQKRKASESLELINTDVVVETTVKKPPLIDSTPTKPALSPLLTSLLKSPSHQQQNSQHMSNSSSILHSAITSQQHQAPPRQSPTVNPTIASLLNSTASVTVSPGIQQLVTSAISQAEPTPTPIATIAPSSTPTANQLTPSVSDLLSDSEVPNLKDIEKTISIDHPLPEMKNEEVDTIISDLIDNNDIVSDPEKHLLGVNDDDIFNSLENDFEELTNEEKADVDAIVDAESTATNATAEKNCNEETSPVKEVLERINLQPVVVLSSPNQKTINELIEKTENVKVDVEVTPEKVEAIKEKVKVEIDPFEFQEDPEIQPSKPSAGLKLVTQQSQSQETNKSVTENILAELSASKIHSRHSTETREQLKKPEVVAKIEKVSELEKVVSSGGSVEIVEVDILEDEDENSNDSYKSNKTEQHTVKQIVSEITITKPSSSDETASQDDKNVIVEKPTSISEEEDEVEEDEEEDDDETNSSTKSSSIDSKLESKVELTVTIEEPPKEEAIQIKNVIISKEEPENKSDPTEVKVKDESAVTSEDFEGTPLRNTFTPDYSNSGDIFDDMNIEVKVGKVKRDYSRTKKKEETDFDLLLAVEKAAGENLDDENTSETIPTSDKPSYTSFSSKSAPKIITTTTTTTTTTTDASKPKIKLNDINTTTDDSNSPWTEEEEQVSSAHMRTRRRYSTPATPVDSVPNSPASSFDDDRDYRNWKKAVLLVHGRLAMHKYSSLFMKSITNDQAPSYHDLVYRPMDLQTIRKNIDAGNIRTNSEFHRDVLLMFANAIMYNDYGSQIYEMAVEMRKEAQEQIQILLQAQLGGDSGPSRRETRMCPADQQQQQQQQQQIQLQIQQAKRKRSSIIEDVNRSVKKRKDE